MINKSLEFHNVTGLEECVGHSGLGLFRFPPSVRSAMDTQNGRYAASLSVGCELRFVTDSPKFYVHLSARDCDGTVIVFNGDVFHSLQKVEMGKITTLQIQKSERLDAINSQMLAGSRFSTNVWRIMIGRAYNPSGNFLAHFHGIDTFGYDLRPPTPEEKPGLRWLAYGSSITHGSGATNHHLSYIQQTALHAGLDGINKGMGGSCHIEPSMVDFLVDSVDWDVASFELGVNMRETYTLEEFELRVTYLLDRLETTKPNKPVVIITIFPNWQSTRYCSTPSAVSGIEDGYNQILRELCSKKHRHNLYLVEGTDLLQTTHFLCDDLIHPSDFGHIEMGRNLAGFLRTRVLG
jgi:lysophospholipase L1-like esterase